jgi:predicted ATPase
MLIRSIKLNNFLSFGPDSKAIELGPLNVLIGPNGSGKSNLLEAISLLKAAPTDFEGPINEGGGVREWLWKGVEPPNAARINAIVNRSGGIGDVVYGLIFTEEAQQFNIFSEVIDSKTHAGTSTRYSFAGGIPSVTTEEVMREFKKGMIDPTKSILAQLKDPDAYPELTYLGDVFSKINLYREWVFGRANVLRKSQSASLKNDVLKDDASNLWMVLNRILADVKTKKKFLHVLRSVYHGISDFSFITQGGTIQFFLEETDFSIPATRLSDGTLRYLCLLAILCHPKPPPLVCIEEPELGLHPDILPGLADLLKEASTRCQIIVTTHSEVLVDAMTDTPEAILVAEKHEGGTEIKRLDPTEMKPWLEKYRLGQLWTSGEIGGNRW